MKEGIGFLRGYRAWLTDATNTKELGDYAEAMWQSLLEPALLNQDKVLMYRAYALMQVCLKSRRKQYLFIRDIALRDQYSLQDLLLCLFGKLIQKLMDTLNSLQIKKQELQTDDFHRYLFAVTRVVLGKCLAELGEEILGPGAEDQELVSEPMCGSVPQSLELLQYNIALKTKARLLAMKVKENWQERELNVLCHDLESRSEKGSIRLCDESRDNVYQLHKRARDRLKKTMAEQGFSEEVGRLFVGKHLRDLCQNCPVLPTYKSMQKATAPRESYDIER